MDNPSALALARTNLVNILSQIPSDWNPHQSLEYMKVSIRSVISDLVGRHRKELRNEIAEAEVNLNKVFKLSLNAGSGKV